MASLGRRQSTALFRRWRLFRKLSLWTHLNCVTPCLPHLAQWVGFTPKTVEHYEILGLGCLIKAAAGRNYYVMLIGMYLLFVSTKSESRPINRMRPLHRHQQCRRTTGRCPVETGSGVNDDWHLWHGSAAWCRHWLFAAIQYVFGFIRS